MSVRPRCENKALRRIRPWTPAQRRHMLDDCTRPPEGDSPGIAEQQYVPDKLGRDGGFEAMQPWSGPMQVGSVHAVIPRLLSCARASSRQWSAKVDRAPGSSVTESRIAGLSTSWVIWPAAEFARWSRLVLASDLSRVRWTLSTLRVRDPDWRSLIQDRLSAVPVPDRRCRRGCAPAASARRRARVSAHVEIVEGGAQLEEGRALAAGEIEGGG